MSVNGEEVQDKRQFAALATSFKEGGNSSPTHLKLAKTRASEHPARFFLCASDRVSLGVYNEKRAEKRKVEVIVLPHRVESLSGEEVRHGAALC
jgi:hypothetical protein